MTKIAFIPMRAGGKRLGLINGKDKDRAELGGVPLAAWTIRTAINSGVFDEVIAVTRSEPHIEMAREYGCNRVLERPAHTVRDTSPDIDWVLWALQELEGPPEMYSILRVTSPFRTAKDIQTAWALFKNIDAHSLRTVTPAAQHPAKMWVIRQGRLLPILPYGAERNPWHSSGTQTLFQPFIQTAGMEMAWSEMTLRTKTIAGSNVLPYVVEGWPALDINVQEDWDRAVKAVENGEVKFP